MMTTRPSSVGASPAGVCGNCPVTFVSFFPHKTRAHAPELGNSSCRRPSPPISLRTKMEAFLCASPAITVAHPVRSPLPARQAGVSISGPRTSLSLPLAAVPSVAASRSRTPGLSSLSGARGGLLRARATSEDDSFTATFGYLGTAPKAGTETVKETAVEKDDPEAPPSAVEDVPAAEQRSSINFFDQLNLQLDSEDTYYILIYGTGALVALWISSAIVGAIDSLPLFPKMLEIIGLGFTVWFTYRYLLFKKNRDELFEKIDHLKEQILGPSVD